MGRDGRIATYLSCSAAETFEVGCQLGRTLVVPTLICFFGELAAGKTTLIKGIAYGASGVDPTCVHSPTFSYLHLYPGPPPIYHFDLYRLRDSDAFLSMGFEEYWEGEGICCVEWAERITNLLPPHHLSIHMAHAGNDCRSIIIHKGEGS